MNSPLTASDLLEFHLDDSVEAARWDELVACSPDADVYHFAAYILASAELEHSQPLGLMISSSNRSYLLPAAANFQPRWAVLVRRQHSLRLQRRDLPRPRFRSCTP
jgi:hypothetical protein